VAPCDPEKHDAAAELRPFAPVPLARLPFPAHVVASTDDPFATAERSRTFADAWGAELALIGPAGHIATASGHGEWPEGRALLARLAAGWSAARG
jgi:hypothetical protein